jgi:hypothetical protein
MINFDESKHLTIKGDMSQFDFNETLLNNDISLLTIEDNSIITCLSKIKGCNILVIRNCSNLKTVKLPLSTTIVYIKKCMLLETLGLYCKNLVQLVINQCEALNISMDMPNLLYLVLRNRCFIRSIPDAQNLKTLDVSCNEKLPDISVYTKILSLTVSCQGCLCIPNFKYLKCLKLMHCRSIKHLPIINTLQTLILINCPNIRDIPKLFALTLFRFEKSKLFHRYEFEPQNYFFIETLDISENVSISRIPAFPNLRDIKCVDCTKLSTISESPNLESLNCSGCSLLAELPKINSLIDLNCMLCEILTSIPTLYNLINLDCSGCRLLTHIGSFISLKRFRCDSCILINHICNMPNLRSLLCNECYSLRYINKYPSLVVLKCDFCINLENIGYQESIEYLSCVGCIGLETTPITETLKYLFCDGATSLKQLPQSSTLEVLSCVDCTGLEDMLPYFPKLKRAIPNFIVHENIMLKELDEFPETFETHMGANRYVLGVEIKEMAKRLLISKKIDTTRI